MKDKETDFPGVDPNLVEALTLAVRERAGRLIPVLAKFSPDAPRVLRSDEFVRDAVAAALPLALSPAGDPRPPTLHLAAINGCRAMISLRLGLYRCGDEWRAAKGAALKSMGAIPESAAVEDPAAEDVEFKRLAAEIIRELPDDQRRILDARSASDESFASIGRGLGFSRDRVADIYHRAVRSVRTKLGLRRDEVYGDERLVRLRLRAAHERMNGLIVQARLLETLIGELDFKHFEGVDAEASRAASRVIRAAMPDLDRVEAASEILARLRLGAETEGGRRKPQLADDVKAVELDIRKLEAGSNHRGTKDTENGSALGKSEMSNHRDKVATEKKGETPWDENERARRRGRRR